MTKAERPGPAGRPLLSVLTLLAFALLVGLGVWQVRRLQWKTELLAEIEAARQAPALPLAEALDDVSRGEPAGWRRVIANCPGLEQSALAEMHAIEEGVVGRRWISACRLEEAPYSAILVDRGFVPQGVAPPPPSGGEGPRPVVGFLRAAEPPGRFAPASSRDEAGGGVWYARDLPGMAAFLDLENAAPVFLMLESPPPASGLPRPAPLPTRISNNHLGYALTWFGLAAALLGVYLAMMFKKPTRA